LSKESTSEAEAIAVKVIKKDNIVLGISDLKQQTARKAEAKPTIVTSGHNKAKAVIVDTNNQKETNVGQQIAAINTIKVNNCEIINRRPRSVTAAIFAHPPYLTSKIEPPLKATSTSDAAAAATTKSSTTKIFRPQSVTSTIFAKRTKDMNKGFLMFSEEEGLTSK